MYAILRPSGHVNISSVKQLVKRYFRIGFNKEKNVELLNSEEKTDKMEEVAAAMHMHIDARNSSLCLHVCCQIYSQNFVLFREILAYRHYSRNFNLKLEMKTKKKNIILYCYFILIVALILFCTFA